MIAPTYDGLIIFDCDGVLIDSENIGSRIVTEELNRLGFAITIEECVLRFNGLSALSLRQHVEAHLVRPLRADFEATLQARIEESYRAELRPIDGMELSCSTCAYDPALRPAALLSNYDWDWS